MSLVKERGEFYRQLEARKTEEEEKRTRLQRFNDRIIKELPSIVNRVIRVFSSLARVPLSSEINEESIILRWAYDSEKIGKVTVKRVRIKSHERYMELRLDPDVGYIGATSKIDFETNVPKAHQKLPFSNEGLFVTIDQTSSKLNKVVYLDRENEFHEFNEEVAIKTLSAVFLD